MSPLRLWAALFLAFAFSGFSPGTIVVKTGERRLYYILDDHRAPRFPVGVGRAGMTWTGTARVEGKQAAHPPMEELMTMKNRTMIEIGG